MLGYAPDMSRFLIILLSCLPLLLSAGEFYKWVDEKGVTHYDAKKPNREAEVITTIDSAPASSRQRPYSFQGSDGDEDDVGRSRGYSKFTIAKPEQNETIRNTEGVVNVSFFLAPGLHGEDKIVVTLDGQKLKEKLSSTQFSLKDIPRGTHTLKADIVDADGETLASTGTVSFHLRQTSILHPKPK
ncbi:MAG: DUF4124 domain-containing protein [Candidatus Polarisedimenticolaceae bacterium]|nr:DUF4124 domain-containing protein [Candidatus Polarisedimenticolaceae bacterium]